MEEKKIDYTKMGQERVISIRELIFECIRRWKAIVICAIVFAVLLGGFKFYKDSKNAQASVEPPKQETAESIEELKDSLTEEELIEADTVVYYKETILELKEYLDNSLAMQLNAYETHVVTLQYFVDNNYVADYNNVVEKDTSEDLNTAYRTFIADGMLASEIKEGLQLEEDLMFVQELLTYEKVGENTFVVEVIGLNEEDVTDRTEKVKEAIAAYQKTVSSQIGAHEVKLVSEAYVARADNTIANNRYAKENFMKEIQTKMTAATEGMSGAQLAYVDARMGVEKAEVLGETETSVKEAPKVHISKKYVVVGALGGIVLAVLVILFVYLMKGTVNSAEDVQYLYNLKMLGKIGKGHPILRERISLEQQQKMLLVNIKTSIDMQDVKKVYATGSCLQQLETEVLDNLKAEIKKMNLPVVFGESFVSDPESLETMLSCDAVILMEKERKTRYTDFVNEYRICNEYQKNILGFVMFR